MLPSDDSSLYEYMEQNLISTKNALEKFIQVFRQSDTQLLEHLLDPEGFFDIQDEHLETLEVSKRTYIEWITAKINDTKISSIELDQCLHCAIGNDVLIINEGSFPRQIKDISERSKTGLMIEIKKGSIKSIKFCYTFVKTENKCMFEMRYPKNDL